MRSLRALFAALSLGIAVMVAVPGCSWFGFRPDLIESAAAVSPQAAFDAVSLEYGKLLVYANAYKRQPGSDPAAIAAIQRADDGVAVARAEAQAAISAGVPGAETRLEIVRTAVSVLRSELIRYGALKVTEGTAGGTP